MLSWKQRCNIFDNHLNIHPFLFNFIKKSWFSYFVIDRSWNKTTHKYIIKSYML